MHEPNDSLDDDGVVDAREPSTVSPYSTALGLEAQKQIQDQLQSGKDGDEEATGKAEYMQLDVGALQSVRDFATAALRKASGTRARTAASSTSSRIGNGAAVCFDVVRDLGADWLKIDRLVMVKATST
ncbi:unnamed protein product [Phytophthora lilii]|uniref:Unnamed protein product n=1 Tax=Phytophthora lilii TaxID=2077276 RepID=A0A9W6TNK5_9STRA|nr:unnamed protein product [Phytophthora lilii]